MRRTGPVIAVLLAATCSRAQLRESDVIPQQSRKAVSLLVRQSAFVLPPDPGFASVAIQAGAVAGRISIRLPRGSTPRLTAEELESALKPDILLSGVYGTDKERVFIDATWSQGSRPFRQSAEQSIPIGRIVKVLKEHGYTVQGALLPNDLVTTNSDLKRLNDDSPALMIDAAAPDARVVVRGEIPSRTISLLAAVLFLCPALIAAADLVQRRRKPAAKEQSMNHILLGFFLQAAASLLFAYSPHWSILADVWFGRAAGPEVALPILLLNLPALILICVLRVPVRLKSDQDPNDSVLSRSERSSFVYGVALGALPSVVMAAFSLMPFVPDSLSDDMIRIASMLMVAGGFYARVFASQVAPHASVGMTQSNRVSRISAEIAAKFGRRPPIAVVQSDAVPPLNSRLPRALVIPSSIEYSHDDDELAFFIAQQYAEHRLRRPILIRAAIIAAVLIPLGTLAFSRPPGVFTLIFALALAILALLILVFPIPPLPATRRKADRLALDFTGNLPAALSSLSKSEPTTIFSRPFSPAPDLPARAAALQQSAPNR